MLRLAVEYGLLRVRHPVLVAVHGLRFERAVHHLVQLGEERIHLPVDLVAQIVAEIVARAAHQEGRGGGRIEIALLLPVHEANRRQRRHQGRDPVDGNARRRRDRARRFRPVRELAEDIDMQAGEQRLGSHETESQPRDVFGRFGQSFRHAKELPKSR